MGHHFKAADFSFSGPTQLEFKALSVSGNSDEMEEAIRHAVGTAPVAAATKVLPHKPAATSPRGKQTKHVTTAQAWHLLRRLLVLAAAGLYVFTTLDGGVKAMRVLYGVADDSLKYPSLSSDLIVPYAGTSTIQKSKLVTSAGGVVKRNDTMYLVSPTTVSFTSCPKLPTYNAWMYGNDFLRGQYADLVRDTSYNITLFKTSDLIAPVVDCTTFMLRSGTTMYMRVFYLLVDKANPGQVSLVTYSFSMQDYRFPDQYQTGVAGVLVLSVVTDMRFRVVDNYYYALALGYPFRKPSYSVFEVRGVTEDGYRISESVLPPGSGDATRVILSSWRTGVFTGAESEQCNIKNINWEYRRDPIDAMKDWKWEGMSLLHDAWAWTHAVHFVFAADMMFNLVLLLLVSYRNLRKGKVWIGDAFVSVSRSITTCGVLVLIDWCINGFWSLMEFCLQEGKILSNTPLMFVHEEIIRADLMVVYLSVAGALGVFLRARIDPTFAVFLFEISFQNRHAIASWFPAAVETVVTFSAADAAKGMIPVPDKLADITPMQFRTTHDLHAKPLSFILATLLPIIVSFAVILAYVILRKIHRKFFPDRMVQLSRGTNLSTESESILAWKSSRTMFEVATGAALQNRVGLVSDYDNCVYIKGMKFASADGIFCNGFVVANGKWLMCTGDLMLILGMLITRVRFADVYVYEVETYTVQKNARLFYPEMMTFWEVFELNTMILA